jgi:hypothetical protein
MEWSCQERRAEAEQGVLACTVFVRVVDEVHDDGVGVGEDHACAGQLGDEPLQQLRGRGVERDGVLVHFLQAVLAGVGEDALRRDAAERRQPAEPDVARAKVVQPLHQFRRRNN